MDYTPDPPRYSSHPTTDYLYYESLSDDEKMKQYIKLEDDFSNKSLFLNSILDKCHLDISFIYGQFTIYLKQVLNDITIELPPLGSIFVMYNEPHVLQSYDWNLSPKELYDSVILFKPLDLYVICHLYSPSFKELVRYPFNKIKDKLKT